MREYKTNNRTYFISEAGAVYTEDMRRLVPHRGANGAVSYLLGGERRSIGRIVLGLYGLPAPTKFHKEIIHIDHCLWNNHYKNLMWVTSSERALRQKPPWWKIPVDPNAEEVPNPRSNPITVDGVWYASVSAAASSLGVRRDCLSRALGSGVFKGMSINK